VEGEDGPFLGERVSEVATCEVTGSVADALRVLGATGAEVVVLVHAGLVVGDIDAEALDGRSDDVGLLDLLRPVPGTVRPSVTVASVVEAGGGQRLVTTSDGHLLGRAEVDPSEHHDHAHDHGDSSIDIDGYEHELAAVMKALQERFGDREVSADEVRSFLRDRLLAEGRSPDEADRFLEQMEGGDADGG